ncbi:MAG TPA: hypothetical protein VF747_00990 [Blastocatellia bacterium]|jgi:hypothetical protein
MSELYQIRFRCGEKEFRIQRSRLDQFPTQEDIREIIEESCTALGFNSPEDLKGQRITLDLIEGSSPQFLVMGESA